MSSSEPLVQVEVEGGVAVLTLTAPPANCYTHEMMRQLDAAILEARFDDEVHVIVLTGAGERFFCAGADISMLKAVTPRFKYYFCLHANETLARLEQTPKLVIAALNGHAVGGGFEVAMACDVRIARASEKAKVGLPEVNLGVLPGTGGTQRLVRLVGKTRALELMVTGDTMSVDQAAEAGLVNGVYTAESGEDFLAQVKAYAAKFVPPGKAARAVGLIKRACHAGADLGLADGLAIERELQQQLFLTQDATEGITAYVEKRSPSFQGL